MNPVFSKPSSIGRTKHGAKHVATINLVTTSCVTVPVALYEKVRSNIIFSLPYMNGQMNRQDNLVPEDLVGLGLWCELTDAEKGMAKACIAHLAQTRVLPIRAKDSMTAHPHFYELA